MELIIYILIFIIFVSLICIVISAVFFLKSLLAKGGVKGLKDHIKQYSFNSLTSAFNFTAILIMLLAIILNYKVSNEHMKALRETTTEQITAIRDASQDYIENIEYSDRRRKEALLSALLVEYKENLRIVKDIIKKEEIYTDEKGRMIPYDIFSYEAYDANLNNGTIKDPALLDEVVKIYQVTKLYQRFLDTGMISNVSRDSVIKSLGKAINTMKANLSLTEQIQAKIEKYKETYYSE